MRRQVESVDGENSAQQFRRGTREAASVASGLLAGRPTLTAAWVGYLFLLEDCEETRRARYPKEPHFPVLDDFRSASYAKRYELLLRRMVAERHYSAACLLLSEPHRAGTEQNYSEPAPDLSVAPFIKGLLRRCSPLADLAEQR